MLGVFGLHSYWSGQALVYWQRPWKVDDVIAGSLTKLMVTTESSVAEVTSPDSTDISMSQGLIAQELMLPDNKDMLIYTSYETQVNGAIRRQQ